MSIRARSRSLVRAVVDILEPRRLMAAISWTGGGDGFSWNDGLNFNLERVPQSDDDVTINAPTVQIRFGQGSFNAARSLTTNADLLLRNAGFSLFDGNLVLQDADVFIGSSGVSPGTTGTLSFGGSLDAAVTGSGRIIFGDTPGNLIFNAIFNEGDNINPLGTVTFGGGIVISGNQGTLAGNSSNPDVLPQQRGIFVLASQGRISADIAAGGGTIAIAAPILNQGTLEARNSATLLVESLLNFNPQTATLTGGAYQAAANGIIRLVNVQIGTLSAGILLSGPGSRILSDFQGTNSAFASTFTIAAGHNFSADSQASVNFQNLNIRGSLNLSGASATVDDQVSMAASGTVTLTGGASLSAAATQLAGRVVLTSSRLTATTLNVAPNTFASISSGTLTATGTTLIQGPILTSGNSVLTFGGSYTQSTQVVGTSTTSGTLSVSDTSTVTFQGAANILGGVLITLGSSVIKGTSLVIGSSGSAQLSGALAEFTGTLTQQGRFSVTSGTFTGASGITQELGASATFGGTAVVNISGPISLAGSIQQVGGTVTFSPTTTFAPSSRVSISNGSLRLSNGGTLSGRIILTGGILSAAGILTVLAGGNIAVSSSGQLQLDAGLVNAGTLTQSGGTTSITSTFVNSGSIDFSGGLVLPGAQLLQQAGARLVVTNSTVTFSDSIVSDGLISVGSGASVNIQLGLNQGPAGTFAVTGGTTVVSSNSALDGLVTLSGGSLRFTGPLLLTSLATLTTTGGTLSLEADTTSGATASLTDTTVSSTGLLSLQGDNSFTIASGVVSLTRVEGAAPLFIQGGNVSISQRLSVLPTETITLTGGVTTLAGTLVNTGAILVNAGTLNLDLPVNQATLGVVRNLGGTVRLRAGVIGGLTLSDTTGSYELAGGSFNGTYRATGAAILRLSNSVIFDAARLEAPVDIGSGTLEVRNSLTLVNTTLTIGATDGTPGTLTFTGNNLPAGQTIAGTGSLVFRDAPNLVSVNLTSTSNDPVQQRLTIATGISVTAAQATFTGSPGASIGLLGALTATGPAVAFSLPLTNLGTLATASNANLTVNSLTNLRADTGELLGGIYIVAANSRLTLPTSITTLSAQLSLAGANAQVLSTAPDTSALAGRLTVAFTGSLTLASGALLSTTAVLNNGTISLGLGARITSSESFSTASVLNLDLAGSNAALIGTIVAGTFAAAGQLNVTLRNNFDYTGRFQATLVDAPSIQGAFANISVGTTPTGQRPDVFLLANRVILASQPPVPASAPRLAASSDTGASNTDFYTADTTPTLVGTGETGDTVQIFIGGVLVASGVVVDGNYAITLSPLGDGIFTAAAFTGAGDPVLGPAFTIDATAPVITPPADIVRQAGASGTVQVGYGTIDVFDALDNAVTLVATPPSGSLFGIGINPVELSATDLAGNIGTANFRVIVNAQPTAGGLDVGFGNGTGIVTALIPNAQITALDSFTLPDGVVLTAGFDTAANQLVLTRLLPSGALDTTFGTAGTFRTAIPGTFVARRVSFEPVSGNIILLGSVNAVPSVSRFLPTGTLDGTFGTGGVLTFSFLSTTDRVDAFTPFLTGFLIGGSAVLPTGRVAFVARTLPTGALDTRAGGGRNIPKGFYARPATTTIDTFNSLAIGPKNVLFAVGVETLTPAPSLSTRIVAVQLSSSLKEVSPFRVRSQSFTGYSIASAQKALVQILDGTNRLTISVLLARNDTEAAAGLFGTAVVRFSSRGLLDTSFNATGIFIVPPGTLGVPPPTTANLVTLDTLTLLDTTPQTAEQALAATSTSLTITNGSIRNLLPSDSGTSTAVTQTQLLPDRVDLRVENLNISASNLSRRVGQSLSATVRVLNQGSLNGKRAAVQLFASPTANFDPATAIALTTRSTVPALKVGIANNRVSFSATRVPTIPGQYFLVAVVNANSAAFTELTLDNNTAISAQSFTVQQLARLLSNIRIELAPPELPAPHLSPLPVA
jgi:hypothetical protein